MPRNVAVTSHLDVTIKTALERLAEEDGRSLSRYVERILIAHLKAKGRLPKVAKGRD